MSPGASTSSSPSEGPRPSSELWKFVRDASAGGASAAIARTIVAPIDRVKLLLQLQHAQKTIAVEERYTGIVDCFTRVVKEQGPVSLWRGNVVNVARIGPQQALNFACKDFYKRLGKAPTPAEARAHPWKAFAWNLFAGGAAGATSLAVIYPLDFARTRLATDIGRTQGTREFNGLFDVVRQILKSDGPIGFYRGFASSLQGIILYRAAYFGLFDTATALIQPDKQKLNFFVAWGIGQVTVVSAGLASYPWDTVRRRMMMQSGRGDVLYRNTWHCWRRVYSEEGGIRAFYKGALSNIFRGMGSALVLAFYSEFAKHFAP